MNLSDDDFSLFGLPHRQAQDRAEIDARWKALQAKVHPDRFVAEGAAAQRLAMQWAMRVNEAQQRLRDPLKRAAYLCELRGAALQAESNTRMPAAFLMEQMAWREGLDEARGAAEVQAIDDEVAAREQALLARVQQLLDEENDAVAAAEQVRALMFIHRFRADIDRRLDALGQ
ncbi:Fe-S protein assembly co-chaperone HscB [Roseateles koreensis]|uniref:Co-chaperone protein HscB homolog n=1 Tax=Roseateles koreensis TaxID=2987526 RepID=A0ABT5KQI8_9BURK|nr:Fe-S protein assembly co-chaperone HscB [Roseateles koreensis]MDC8785116.1 Fe-S protein assembly co-chaperone HscB [Roseateles koreensis]